MNDTEIKQLLESLGASTATWRALAILPLVQVAWADGRVQEAERRLVLKAAARIAPGQDCQDLVDGWLSTPPSRAEYARGHTALVALARRGGLEPHTLTDVVGLCEQVAASAGGLFGVAFTVSDSERDALRDIAHALSLGPTVDWETLEKA